MFVTNEWTGTKTVIFRHKNDIPVEVILDDDNMCKVPWEVIKAGSFSVSVFCGDLITTNSSVVMVGKSGYAEAGEPKEPTPDVYTQIIEMLDTLKAGGADEESINAAIVKYMEENPIETLSEDDIKTIVSDYMTENPVQTLTEDDVNSIINNAGLAKADDIPSTAGLASEEYVSNAINALEARIAKLEESNTSTDDGNNSTAGTEDDTNGSGDSGNTSTDGTGGDDSTGDSTEGDTTEEVLPEGCMWIEQGSWDYEGNKVDSTTRVRIDSFVDISEILGSTVSIDVKAADGSDVHFLARMHNESADTYVNANHASGSGFVTSTASVTSNKWYTRFTIIMTADEDETVDATPSQFDGVIVTVKQGSSVYKTITLKAHAS